jgi:hypothetical protein
MLCTCATGSWVISALVGHFDRKWRESLDWKRTCPEVALTGSRFCVCPSFSRAFFFVVVPWLPDVTKGHLTASGFPWVCPCATGSCATPIVNEGHVTPLWKCHWGVLYDVHVLYLAWLLELTTRVLYLAWWLELGLVICPFYFRIVSRLCSTLLRKTNAKGTFENFQLQNVFFLIFLHF